MSDPRNVRPDAFVGTAEAYARWRPPYPPAMLDEVLREAKVGPDASTSGRLLDLATGPGRIALALADRFAEVWALDLEPEMIAVARAAAAQRGIANVKWLVGRAEDLEAPERHFDLVTFGESFHRLDQVVVAAKARRWLKVCGGLVTMGAGAILNSAGDWQAAAAELARRWTAKSFPTGWAPGRPGVDNSLEASIRRLQAAGFELVANSIFVQPHDWSFEGVLGYMHSTSVASRQVLGDDADAFAAALADTLAPFADAEGRLQDEIEFGWTLLRNPD
jgi:SAM-dependent methyltransferase